MFAANYAVDKLMNSMAGGFEIEADDNSAIVEPAVAAGDASAEPAATENPVATEAPASTPAAEAYTNEENSGEQSASATDKPAATPVPTAEGVDGIAHISTDKALEVQDSVTLTDKANVAAIVAQQLSVSDIKRLQELASGGLTNEEKREARSIILGKVSEEQYNELSQIAKKYGVSQGRTRDQIIAEEEQIKAQEQGSE
ncbi:hypothetical protein C2I18_05895 [Paenibacillus sp. PK3_47]|nr:hypothetical protein C2I18_05895 [Paenibacillus sp. PK3_47]